MNYIKRLTLKALVQLLKQWLLKAIASRKTSKIDKAIASYSQQLGREFNDVMAEYGRSPLATDSGKVELASEIIQKLEDGTLVIDFYKREP